MRPFVCALVIPAAGGLLVVFPATLRAQAAGPPAWVFVTKAQETWDSNPFLRDVPGEGTFVHRLGLDLSHVQTGARSSLALSGQAAALIYDGAKQLNHFDYSLSGVGTFRLTPRATLTLNQDFVSSYRYSSPLVGYATELLPLVLTRVSVSQAGLAFKLSERTTASAKVGYTYVSFDSPQLFGGSILTGETSLTRQISPHDSVAVSYDVLRSNTESKQRFGQTLSGGWSRSIVGTLSALVSGGATYYSQSGLSARPWGFYASVGVDKRLRRATLGVHYSHAIGQAFGLGQDRVADTVTALGNFTLTRHLQLLVAGAYTHSRDPVSNGFLFDTQGASGTLSYGFTRRLTLDAGYLYGRRKDVTFKTAVVSSQAFLSLSSAWQWH